ncbi:MAG TPA: N-acetyl-gamma-glutamyl-phosphate reductase [Burkholderiaceae bacterium]|nr:N-acetyl-gamma-glutamyl-phosphate reductase [Burkholderiaceae bacterium]
MSYVAYVDGQEGTTGLQIHDLLARRRDIEVLRIAAERRKDDSERKRLLNAADVAFLCLPDQAAREAASWVTNSRTCVIDASTAHRVDPAWVFGLPELAPGHREHLRRSKRISNPGCHSTAFILLIRPLVDAGLIAPDTRLSATSITGYSGGGRKLIEQYEATAVPARLMSPRPYGLSLAHKHVPEMTRWSGLQERPVFMPVVANFYKGLAVSVPLHFADMATRTSATRIHEALREHYVNERFVKTMPLSDVGALDAGYFDIQACNGTNRCELFVFAADDRAILLARLDNLGKGASGAAVQAMNVHLGLDEGLGLAA